MNDIRSFISCIRIYRIINVDKGMKIGTCVEVAQFRFIEVDGLFRLKPIYGIKPLYLQIVIFCRSTMVLRTDTCVHVIRVASDNTKRIAAVLLCILCFAFFSLCFFTEHFFCVTKKDDSKSLCQKKRQNNFCCVEQKKIETHKSRLAFCPFFLSSMFYWLEFSILLL